MSRTRPGRLVLLAAGALLLWGAAPVHSFLAASSRAGGVSSQRSLSRMQAGLIDEALLESDFVLPDKEPMRPQYLIGFNNFAEMLNGRIAMIAFFVLIFLEAFAGKGIFQIFGFEDLPVSK
eukprot:CAMPEP_0197656516 /NCGR_PEP_ID=MMETSP1338-20131121/42195_1 /TAXON_ID=43686 ORGANISM="Pelagodinium beii, Strain RCC1491" /NCGR_SAMPLE_ID=MMETSP1338 /ASSEMBLY_ACC=CAM_ASM_000754 /LENGTH=120 /DNA_ID=CAMNT_0043232547 /DNA_START=18 /DNA_END=380 /DNA_ORIENTATION=-